MGHGRAWPLRWSARSARSSAGTADGRRRPCRCRRRIRSRSGTAAPLASCGSSDAWTAVSRTSTRGRSARPAARRRWSGSPRAAQATLYSYVINHRPAPGFEDEAPYAIAVVQLAEGPRMMTNLTGVAAHARGSGARHAAAGHVRAPRRGQPAAVRPGAGGFRGVVPPGQHRGPRVVAPPATGTGMTGVIIAGAAETDQVGKLPEHSTLQLHPRPRSTRSPTRACRSRTSTGSRRSARRARSRSRTRSASCRAGWTAPRVGGTSFLLHVRHAAAAIRAGYATTVLITHGESGRSRVGAARYAPAPSSMPGSVRGALRRVRRRRRPSRSRSCGT